MERIIRILILILVVLVCLGGCTKKGPEPIIHRSEKNAFDQSLKKLIDSIIEKEQNRFAGLSSVAVLPGSLKTGFPCTRLEEVVVERLKQELGKHHEMVKLSRNHWFEYREQRPLNTSIYAGLNSTLIRNLTIYNVDISPDDVMEEVRVTVSGYNSEGRSLAGLTASTSLDFRPGMLGRMLFDATPNANPFPKGMEENPYTSVDRLCFSLASELADAYRTGIKAGGKTAADNEIKVLLYVNPKGRVSDGAMSAISHNLQQAVVSNRGFTCVVSKDDFGPAFEQVDFYKENYEVFDIEDPRFQTGTVFLMADVYAHPSARMTGINLRAIWRISPIEDQVGGFIAEDAAGTYLSGFTAKAYLTGSTGSILAIPDLKRVDACFYHVTPAAERQLVRSLNRIDGIDKVSRDDLPCSSSRDCVCYNLSCWVRAGELSRMLVNDLSDQGDQYQVRLESESRFSVYYRGGFD